MSDSYVINEIFYSIQGEGIRAGTANVFIRFAHCNLRCAMEPGPKSVGGFDCDTEFTSGKRMTLGEISAAALDAMGLSAQRPAWMILTGGEPAAQVDAAFCEYFHGLGWHIAIETNGSIELPLWVPEIAAREDCDIASGLTFYKHFDWITVSPKVAEHCIRQVVAHEIKYVRNVGQEIPVPRCRALHYLVSPAFDGEQANREALAHCIGLVKRNPNWRLSVQQHRAWRIR